MPDSVGSKEYKRNKGERVLESPLSWHFAAKMRQFPKFDFSEALHGSLKPWEIKVR